MATSMRSLRPRQAFAATTPKLPPVRHLHITGAQNQPSSYLAFQTRVAELGRQTDRSSKPTEARPFNTHRALRRRGDHSPIDLCYFPQAEPDPATLPRVPLIPLLPDSERPAELSTLQHGEAVPDPVAGGNIRVIATSSGIGVDEGIVQAMSEAENTHHSNSGAAVGIGAARDPSELRAVWDGFLDDLLGGRAAQPKA